LAHSVQKLTRTAVYSGSVCDDRRNVMMLAQCATAGYVRSVHRPENELILLHVPEILGGDRNSKYMRRPYYTVGLQVNHTCLGRIAVLHT